MCTIHCIFCTSPRESVCSHYSYFSNFKLWVMFKTSIYLKEITQFSHFEISRFINKWFLNIKKMNAHFFINYLSIHKQNKFVINANIKAIFVCACIFICIRFILHDNLLIISLACWSIPMRFNVYVKRVGLLSFKKISRLLVGPIVFFVKSCNANVALMLLLMM